MSSENYISEKFLFTKVYIDNIYSQVEIKKDNDNCQITFKLFDILVGLIKKKPPHSPDTNGKGNKIINNR